MNGHEVINGVKVPPAGKVPASPAPISWSGSQVRTQGLLHCGSRYLARTDAADLLVLGTRDDQMTHASIGDWFRQRVRRSVVIVDADGRVVHGREHLLAMPQPLSTTYWQRIPPDQGDRDDHRTG